MGGWELFRNCNIERKPQWIRRMISWPLCCVHTKRELNYLWVNYIKSQCRDVNRGKLAPGEAMKRIGRHHWRLSLPQVFHVRTHEDTPCRRMFLCEYKETNPLSNKEQECDVFAFAVNTALMFSQLTKVTSNRCDTKTTDWKSSLMS